MKRVVLLGAGHAQLSVLAALARQRLASAEVTLVTAYPRQMYSGMVPGWIGGRYTEAQCSIAVEPLARAAHAKLVLAKAVAVNAAAQTITLADGKTLGWDVLSLNTGPSQTRERIPGAREHALFVRPIEDFVQLWQRMLALAATKPLAVVVIGNGAAGVELALAMRHALQQQGTLTQGTLTLVSDGPLLAIYPAAVQRRALRALKAAGIQVVPGRCTGIEAEHVVVNDATRIACDAPVVATGADAPQWLAGSGLALNDAGFVRVGATLQSASHPHVLAAGDIIARDDVSHPRSGVYAVRAGPVLAANLRAVVGGGTLVPYKPQARSLNLLALGDGRAIASWGAWSMQGRVMGWWKDHIDRAFTRRYVVVAR
jgi:pyridine nucleotide-disulfide oxidoreductase family protein